METQVDTFAEDTIFFNVPEAREHLISKGFVYTIRKQRRTGKDTAYKGSYFKKDKLGPVSIEFIKKVYSAKDLEPYLWDSGFQNIESWWEAKAPEADILYLVTLRESKVEIEPEPLATEQYPPTIQPVVLTKYPQELTTVHITKEAQEAMLELIKRAKGKKVEFQLQLLLSDNKIYPGEWKWGATEKIRALPGFGIFHTHPGKKEAKLSDTDIIHLLVSEHRIIGVAGEETYLVRTMPPYDLKETADVQFAVRIKEYPEKEKLLGLLPLVAELGVPVKGLEEFYRIYEFTLGPTLVPLDVLLEISRGEHQPVVLTKYPLPDSAGLKKWWDETYGSRYVIRTKQDLDAIIKHLGYESLNVPETVKKAMLGVIPTDQDIVNESQKRLSQVRSIPDNSLTKEQRVHLTLAREVAKDMGDACVIKAAIIPPASDRVRTAGVYSYLTKEVFISPEQLSRGQTTVDTIIHELAHHTSGAVDGEETHTLEMPKIASIIVGEVSKGRYDQLLGNNFHW